MDYKLGVLGGGEGVTLKEQFPFLRMVWDYLWSHFFKTLSGTLINEFEIRGNLCFVYRFQGIC